jgi:hypothetical protein
LIERMQGFALGVLGETVGFDKTPAPDNARDGCVFCELLLFDEKLEGAKAAAASLYAIGAGFFAAIIDDAPHAQRLEETAAFDIGGKAFDGNAGLDLADVAFVKDKLVEGNGLGRGKGKFLEGFGHGRRLLG